jgi:predicted GNAT family acetyltransferase
MENLLNNPVFNALLSGDQTLSFGTADVKFFDEAVSPFAGFDENNIKGFAGLHELLPAGRKILYATPADIAQPNGWQLTHKIKGLQFVYEAGSVIETEFPHVQPLSIKHVDQMIELATLTKPGPFASRTIDFGHYHGIFENEKLVAMTGQRLHVQNYTEVSAVCTHPDHTGKGYAYNLLMHQLQLILKQGQQPFLHVKEDNHRAIALYERIGFVVSRQINFYFMKKL